MGDYKKAMGGSRYKHQPFGGSSHAKGIVVEKVGIEAKQPNSAIRKCCRAQLIKNGKKITAFVPNDGCLNSVDENDEVLIAFRAPRSRGRRHSWRSVQGREGGWGVSPGALQGEEGEAAFVSRATASGCVSPRPSTSESRGLVHPRPAKAVASSGTDPTCYPSCE